MLDEQSDAARLASELFMAVLSREPSEEEVAEITRHFADRPSSELRSMAVGQAVWALLTTTEFCLNH